MATETPAQTLLRIERQNIEKMGEATPTPATGPITRTGYASTLPSGFGADTTNRIFRYNGDGSLNTGSTPSATPAAQAPATDQNTSPSYVPTLVDAWGRRYSANSTPPPPPTSGGDSSGQTSTQAKTIDEAAIREDVRRQQQMRIDAINDAYNEMVRRQTLTNIGNEGSVRAINARSGLLGSDFGNANDMNQKQTGNSAINAINAERAVKISNLLAENENLATQRIEFERKKAQEDTDRYNADLEKLQAKSKDLIKQMGESGVSLDQFKQENPSQFRDLLQNSGMSEFELALRLNSAKKAGEQIDWKTDIKGNHVIAYGVNPITGKMEYHTQELPAEAAGNEVKIIEGELWSVSPDGMTGFKIGGPGKKPDLPTSAQEYEFAVARGYKGSYSDYQNEDANRKAVIAGTGGGSTPTSYKEWELAGSPGTYAEWLKKSTPETGLNNETIKLIQDAPETKKIEVLANLKDKLDAYRTSVEQNGFQVAGEKAAALDALYAQLQVAYKDAAGLGALTGPDLELLSRAIKPSSGLSSLFSYGTSGGKEGVLSSINQALNALDTTAARQVTQFNAKFGQYQDSPYVQQITAPFAPTESPPDPEVQELLNAGYSQDQINQLLGKTNDLSMSQNYSGTDINRLANAIGQYESGGNYQARGPVVPGGMYRGQRALGKYQIMPGNLRSWSVEALGRPVTEQEFLSNPKIQDVIAMHQMKKHLSRYGTPEDVASIWLSGRPVSGNRRKDLATGVSVPQYVKNVMKYYS